MFDNFAKNQDVVSMHSAWDEILLAEKSVLDKSVVSIYFFFENHASQTYPITQFLPSSGPVSSTIWMHPLDADWAYR